MMQRSRNRQGRGASQTDRGRGNRGRRGGRGRVDRQYDDRGPSNVPNTSQVIPGGFVSIVLKVHQPTGREVQGVVADVLTSGNHPRGIKVRLVDGRVGRVQRMCSEDEARRGAEGLSGLGRNGEVGERYNEPWTASRMRHSDVRQGDDEIPASGYSLGDFLPPGHPLRDDNTEQQQAISEVAPEVLVKCPVCGEFEGDEAAVSHHVNTHFD